MKNLLITSVLLILLIPMVSASMSFGDFDSQYRLGDSISPRLTISGDYDGFLSVNLVCDDSFSYYYSPINIDSSKVIDLPTLKFVDGMDGSCYLDSKIESFSKKILESERSQNFKVSSSLKVNVTSYSESILPGEDVKVSLKVDSNNFKVTGRNFDFEKSFDNNEISFSFPSEVGVGYFEYRLTIRDDFDNVGVVSIPVIIKSVPTSLQLNLNKETFNHKENLEVSSVLLDQSNKQMDGNVTIYFLDDVFQNSFSQSLEFMSEGSYTITSVFNNFKEVKTFNILPSREVLVTTENEDLVIRNTGNTFVDEVIEVSLNSEKKYLMNERLVLSPNSTKIVHLEDLVPTGYYNISVSGMNEEGVKKENLENIYLIDSRDLVTKLNQGIGFLTGDAIIDLNWNGNTFFLLFFVLLIILVIFISNWKFKHGIKKVFTDLSNHHKAQTENLTQTLNSTISAKQRLERAFTRHVDPSVVKELISTDDLEGKKQKITVMYADIRGFTKLSEDEDVWFIVNLLNSYFEKFGLIVKKHKGIIDKYIGDSLMALFNTPIKTENHELSAIKCALEIQKVVKDFNKTLEEKGKKPISLGIGINSGEAVVGFIGSSTKLEYTAIGNTVNLAARLESKSQGILITQDLYQKVKDKVYATPVGYLEFKNVKNKVYCYNVTNLKKLS